MGDIEEYVLPQNFSVIPLEALNASCRKEIALYMDSEGSFDHSTGLLNNYLGLAEKVGFRYLEISNITRNKNPTEYLLEQWTFRPELSPTVGALWNFLRELGRVDVLTDVWQHIKRDCDKFIEIKSRFPSPKKPIQDKTVSQSTTDDDHMVDVSLDMAVDDLVRGVPTIFDAFVCYSPEGADLAFVHELIEVMENQNGLKLFVPWRDDLPGASHNTVCAKLIQNRCKRMIIVLSPRYLKSSSCDFQTKFAHGLAPGSRNKKLIPVLIENCAIPEILQHVTMCNYTRKDLLPWFWNRLVISVKADLRPSQCHFPNPDLLHSISLDTSSDVSVWSNSTSSSGYNSNKETSKSSMSSSSNTSSEYVQPVSTIPTYMEFVSSSPTNEHKPNIYEKLDKASKPKKKEFRLSDLFSLSRNHHSSAKQPQSSVSDTGSLSSSNSSHILSICSPTSLTSSPTSLTGSPSAFTSIQTSSLTGSYAASNGNSLKKTSDQVIGCLTGNKIQPPPLPKRDRPVNKDEEEHFC